MDSERNSRLIDFWIDSEEKKSETKPTPMFNLVWDSFFGWIWYVFMLLVIVAPSLGAAQNTLEAEQQPRVVGRSTPQSIEMPDSWTAPRPIQVWNTGCCCENNTAVINQIYQNQLFNDVQNRPSTIKETHEAHFSGSSSLSDLLGK